jgi:hypothetical protein
MIFRTLTLLLLLGTLLAAQTPTAAPTLKIPPAAQAGPGFNAEAATRAYLATQTPEQKARSDAYFEGGYWLILWDFLYGAAILILLLVTGFSRRMRAAAERITRRKPLVTWLYWAEYSVVLFALGLLLAVCEGFLRERQYGLMNQTFAAWFVDQSKELALGVVLGGLVVMALFGDPAVLPLAILVLSVLFLVGTPVLNTLVRTQEYEADIFGLNAARQPDGEAEVDVLLGEYRKLDPTPLEEFIFFDHPSGRTRIYAAMRWKAENQCLVDTAKPCGR